MTALRVSRITLHMIMSSLNSDFSDTYQETAGSGSVSTEQSKKHLKKGSSLEAKTTSRPNVSTCNYNA